MKNINSRTKFIVFTAVFAALSIVTKVFDIDIGLSNRVTFFYTVVMLAGIYMGPLCGFTAGIVGDIVGLMIVPSGPFNPFISLASGLWGLIPGLIFWYLKLKSKTLSLLVSYLASFLLATCLLTTYGLFMMYGGGNTFYAYLMIRFWVQLLVVGLNYGITLSLMNVKELKRIFAFKEPPAALSEGQGIRKRLSVFGLTALSGISFALALVFIFGGSISGSWEKYYADGTNYITDTYVVTPANPTDSVPVDRTNGEKLLRLKKGSDPVKTLMTELCNIDEIDWTALDLKAGDAVTVTFVKQHSNYRTQDILVALEKDGVTYLDFETGSGNLIENQQALRSAQSAWMIVGLVVGVLSAAGALVIVLLKKKNGGGTVVYRSEVKDA